MLKRREKSRRGFFGAGSSEVDTIKTLLIRVSFDTDREDELSSIATELQGDFDLTPNGRSIIDPTPHNRSYFDSHMTGLANYFRYQSCGRLKIEWVIMPEGEDESYKLSDLADYGPGGSGIWTIERLVTFFRHCIEAADQEEGCTFPFGEYDAIIIAHAGANLQSDIDFDTPNDIPSFFATLGDDDIFTVGSGDTIFDGSVVPETAIQDGFNGGIAAVLAHEFGHQLGLPDLYNIYTNGPVVGEWDNMDSGGLLGAYLEDEEGRYHYAEG
ncbi:MAG: immune inhibitor A, partial [Candidatus Krumholzibacteria bacterium]|nr:immune inhibitor A [Candidatus Krumholzibacteria bacterium]